MGHHYLPQVYLESFAAVGQSGAVWQFDKRTGGYSENPLPIKVVAQQREFYTAEIEARLNSVIEVPANRVLRKLRSDDFTLPPVDRVHLAAYIATMLKRVPGHRLASISKAPSILAGVARDVVQEIRAHECAWRITSETAVRREQETAAVVKSFSQTLPAEIIEQINNPWPSEELVTLVHGMQWRFVRASKEAAFITSDNPAFYFKCWGLGRPESELTFPISPCIALFGSWKQGRFRQGSIMNQFAKEANRRIRSIATRFLYSNIKMPWLKGVAEKTDPYLSRIQW